jgi:hypothetical protein
MPEADQTLTFAAWARDQISDLVTAQAGGRVDAAAAVTVSAANAAGEITHSATRMLRFQMAGAADVTGLAPAAIVRRYPPPGTLDHESDRCPYVEFSDAALPWRYTPAPTPDSASPNLHPWLMLLVGEEPEELSLADQSVTIAPGIQGGAHAIGAPFAPFRFAHVQSDAAGHRATRLLCGRPLKPGADYLAVLVPAYNESGAPSWTGAAPITVPVLDAWRFRTAVPAGSFEELAAQLRPGDAPATTGRAPLRYARVDDAPELEVAGALVALLAAGAVSEPPLPTVIADDVAALRLPSKDPDGRPIVALPR